MIFQVSRLFHSSSKKQFCNSTKKVTGAKAADAVTQFGCIVRSLSAKKRSDLSGSYLPA